MKKKAVPTLLILLILVCAGGIIALLGTEDESDPVAYQFDQNVGILTFSIVDESHSLLTVTLENQSVSGLSIPAYDESTREISFDINEIAPNQYEGIRICTAKFDDEGNVLGNFNANYRVFRSDTNQEVTIEREILEEAPERETFPYAFTESS